MMRHWQKAAGPDAVAYEGKPSPVMVAVDYSRFPRWCGDILTPPRMQIRWVIGSLMLCRSRVTQPTRARQTISSTVWAEATRSLTDKTGFAPTAVQVATEVGEPRALTDKTGFAIERSTGRGRDEDIEVGLSTREAMTARCAWWGRCRADGSTINCNAVRFLIVSWREC